MTYELLKKLKNAGFPWKSGDQSKNMYDAHCPQSLETGEIFHTLECGWGYKPTLSELIEACGDGFISLMKDFTGEADEPKEIKILKKWYAGIPRGWDDSSAWIDEELPCGEGKTPEEAVANLWLKLNS